ncbi:MAG: c-type cytochrome [Limisphaerales bacterium]
MMADDPKPIAQEDEAKPSVGHSSIPMWLIILFALLFYWSQLYLSDHAGGFSAEVYTPYESFEQVAAANPQDPEARKRAMGRDIYHKTCELCHQINGMGQEGKAPPLVGSEWVLAPHGDRIVRIALNGLTGPVTVKGQEWNLTMPPWRDNYNDEQIAAVLTYIRSSLGDNKAAAIDPTTVTGARAENHPSAETSDELLKISVQ